MMKEAAEASALDGEPERCSHTEIPEFSGDTTDKELATLLRQERVALLAASIETECLEPEQHNNVAAETPKGGATGISISFLHNRLMEEKQHFV